MSLGGTVPKHSNTSRIPAQGMQNTSQKNSANVTSSTTIGKCSLAAQFRNTRTPAGFELWNIRPSSSLCLPNSVFSHRIFLHEGLEFIQHQRLRETFERQQDSSPRHAKHKPEKLCERYLYQWQMSLGGTVPKRSNTSRIPAQGMQNTSQKNSANVTFTSGKCPLEAQFRNPRTPAGFELKACKTQARKTLRTLPLESIKNNNSIAREMPLQQAKPLAMPLGGTGPKHSNATSTKWHAKRKPEKLCERYLYQWQMSLAKQSNF